MSWGKWAEQLTDFIIPGRLLVAAYEEWLTYVRKCGIL